MLSFSQHFIGVLLRNVKLVVKFKRALAPMELPQGSDFADLPYAQEYEAKEYLRLGQLNSLDIDADLSQCGLAGSPTKVKTVENIVFKAKESKALTTSLYRDARIFNIYEGTTQMQVVAAIRYVTNGLYATVIQDLERKAMMVGMEGDNTLRRLKEMASKFNACTAAVKEVEGQEFHDLCARHLYEMAANIIMSHLLMQNALKAPQLFGRSLQVYVNMAEAEVEKQFTWIRKMTPHKVEYYRQK